MAIYKSACVLSEPIWSGRREIPNISLLLTFHMWKEKYPTPVCSSHTVPYKGRKKKKKPEKHLWSSQSKGTGSLKDRSNHRTEEYFPATTPHHHITKGPFIAVLLPGTSCSALKKTDKVILKAKTHNLKNGASIRTRYYQEYWNYQPWSLKQLWEGNGNPLQYSCLKNPIDRGAWWGAKSRTQLSEDSLTHD